MVALEPRAKDYKIQTRAQQKLYSCAMLVRLPKLRHVREHHLWTQVDLSTQSGVSRQTIIRIESGGQIRPQTARTLAKVLGTSVGFLMGDPNVVERTDQC